MSVAAITVTTNATLIIAANKRRARLIMYNNSANIIYIGDGSGVTTSTGIPLAVNGTWRDEPNTEDGTVMYKGAYYGIASGSSDLRVMETAIFA